MSVLKSSLSRLRSSTSNESVSFEEALSKQEHEMVRQLLLKDKKRLNQRFMNGQTALHISSDYGDIKTVKVLLKQKADVNAVDDSTRQTCLHVACKTANLELVTLLLRNDADPSLPNYQENTPLHFLVGHKPADMMLSSYYAALAQLKRKGANLNARSNYGDTALHCACLKGSEKLAMWLLREGSDISICNRKGETALHYAAQRCSKEFVSLLISVGAQVGKKGVKGTAKEYAMQAGREEIVECLEVATANTSEQSNTSIVLNGTEISKEKLEYYKSLLAERKSNQKQLTKTHSHSRVSQLLNSTDGDLEDIIASMIDINLKIVGRNEVRPWEGILRFLVGEDWISEFSRIDGEKISPTAESPVKEISFDDLVGFRVYTTDTCRFSLLFYRNVAGSEKHLAAKPHQLQTVLEVLVANTAKPVDFIDNRPFMEVLESFDVKTRVSKGLLRSRVGRTYSNRFLSTSVGTNSLGSPRKILSSRLSLGERTELATSGDRPFDSPLVSAKGVIQCPFDFSSNFYSEVFSQRLQMKESEDNCNMYYILSSGTLLDVMHFLLLHSGQKHFKGNTDTASFYLSYYRYCKPEEIINSLREVWTLHKSLKMHWPYPYNQSTSERRLFAFIEGFIQSPFVLTDKDAEIHFRESLVGLYDELNPSPKNKERNTSALTFMIQNMKKAMEKASLNQLCDLGSLLRSGPVDLIPFHIDEIPVEIIVAQIVNINADLYKQLQITEFLDLRYQKRKDFAVSLNKLHEFSNKIYLLVPTTILQPDNLETQKKILKRWVVIAEQLYHLRDYNSTIQVINGIQEPSITRLKHLKESLSFKWVERFTELARIFHPEDNFGAYNRLSKVAPCIPFIGASLKNLVYAYDGNPDYVEDGVIHFQKMRLVYDIVQSLRIGKAKQFDYSFLDFDPQVSQALLNSVPLVQDDLFARSEEISNSIFVSSEECDDNELLKKENKYLRAELERLKTENEKQAEMILSLRKQLKEKNPWSSPQIATRTFSVD